MKSVSVVFVVLAVTVRAGSSYAQWSPVNGMSGHDVISLAAKSKDTIFVGTNADGVYRTYENGASWSLVLGFGLYDVYKVFSLAIDPSGNVYAGSYSLGLLRSTDHGDSWTFMSANGLPQSDVYAVVANSSGTVFASDDGSIYRSTDNGTSWTAVRSGSAGAGGLCSIACQGSDTVYACGVNDWFYYSTNNGSNWTWVGSSPSFNKNPRTVAAKPGGEVFVGTGGGGVFRSTDGGQHWSAANNGLPNVSVNTLSMSTLGTIYAGTTGGVFFSMDDGANWASANGGLIHTDIRAFALDSLGHVFAGASTGSSTGGLWQATSPLPVQLIKFTANAQDGAVILQWSTASEVNNYGFEIQQSLEQKGAYETIPGSFVKGNGTTIQEHSYRYTIVSPPRGLWYYRLRQIDLDGTVAYSEGILAGGPLAQRASECSLDDGYPNPFNPSTTIRFTIVNRQLTVVKVYDVLGCEVSILVNEVKEPGTYTLQFSAEARDGRQLTGGVYFCRMTAGKFTATKKLMLMK
jgi:photosystem II stability/assembly factor-like uncharacterized protein